MKPRLLLPLGMVLSVSCQNDKGGEDSGAAAEDPWADRTLYGFANIDDDDRDGRVDYGRDAEGEDDRFDLVLPDTMFVDAPGGGTLQLQLRGDVDAVRVLDDGVVLLDADEETTGLDIPADGLALAVEFGSMAAHAWLDVELQDAGGEVIESMRIGLQSAPLILNHHLQPVESVFAMSTGDSGGNAAFTNGFADALDDRFETFRLSRYGWDVWIQDEIELATLTAPDGRRMDVVIDSIRNRAGQFLGALPEEEFEAPGFAVETWGRGRASSQDSFGNLEVSPPVTVDGVLYPFGRAYHGRWFRDEMHEEMVSMLEAQRVQDPFEIDVGFLCVGHVDEFTTFVPDPSSGKGFRFVVADVALAYAFLEAQRGSTRLPKYASDHGYGTIGDLVDDRALRAMNEEIQEDYIDPAVETFKAELGLTEADITRIPALFEEVRGCGGTTAGLIPGTANMTVAPLDSGETHLFLPDPFLRPSGDGVEDDPFVAEIERLLPGGLAFHWLDDWDYYHTMLGEVHCGSNAVRTPIDDWWVAARHLLADGEEE